MQPVVILGGFLITDEAYGPMAEWLNAQGGIDVSVVHASRLDWLLTSSAWGWQRLLKRVDHCVRQARDRCAGAPVTLIGHSSGGVMLRLYLAEHGLEGASLNGQKLCNRLISLGSPHQAKRATRLRALVDRLHPGCAFAPEVDYVSVAGRLDLSSRASQRLCPPQRGQLLPANRRPTRGPRRWLGAGELGLAQGFKADRAGGHCPWGLIRPALVWLD